MTTTTTDRKALVSIYIESSVIDEIEAYGRKRGIGRSAAAGMLIKIALEAGEQ